MGYKLKRILIYPDGVTEKQVYPATGWKPGANTLAYYPLEKDTLDYSGNNRNGTNSNVTFSNGVAHFNGSNAMVTIADASWQRPTANFTVMARFNSEGPTTPQAVVAKAQSNATAMSMAFYIIGLAADKRVVGWFATGNSWNSYPGSGTATYTPNQWHLLTLTNDGTTKTVYLDKTVAASASAATTSSTSNIPLTIGNATYCTVQQWFKGNIAKVILEDKTWSLADISDYYDNNMPS